MGDLFDLSAKLSVNTSDSDKALTTTQQKVLALEKELKELEAKFAKASAGAKAHGVATTNLANSTGKLSDVLRGLTSTTTTLQGPLGGVAGRLSSLGTLASALVSPMAAVGVAIGALAALGVAAGVGVFKLAEASAEATGHLNDLAQQTGFSVETLSALKNAAETSGGSIETVTGALGIFQRHMEEANEGNKEMSRLLRILNIDFRDNEKALRQAFTVLSRFPEGAQQTALSMQLFGRSGREVLAIFKETGGDLDAFTQKLRDMGILISTEAAKKGDELSDSLTVLGQRFEALTRSIATAATPIVEEWLKRISEWLDKNQTAVIEWGQSFITTLGSVANGFAEFVGGAIDGTNTLIDALWHILEPINAAIVALRQIADESHRALGGVEWRNGMPNMQLTRDGKLIPGPPANVVPEGEFVIPGSSVPGGRAPFRSPRLGGGGGGSGGGGSKTDAGITLLKQLEKEFFNLTQHTKLEEIQERLLEKQFAKTSDEIKKRITITAMDIDTQKKILGLTRERYASEASYARFQEEEFIKSLTRVRQLSQMERERFASRAGQNRAPWIDLGGGSTVGGEPGTTGRSRIATVDRQLLQEQIEMFNDRMHQLAGSLTSIIDRSISEGFQHGIAAGVRSFAEGILEMMRSAALAALEKRLFDVFAKLLGGGGGGGIGAALGGLFGGSAGGGISTGGNWGAFASGGFMQPNSWGLVGERGPELIRAGSQGASVVPNGAMGSHTFIVQINVPNIQAAGGAATQHQIAKQLHGMMAKAVLTG